MTTAAIERSASTFTRRQWLDCLPGLNSLRGCLPSPGAKLAHLIYKLQLELQVTQEQEKKLRERFHDRNGDADADREMNQLWMDFIEEPLDIEFRKLRIDEVGAERVDPVGIARCIGIVFEE